jgi:N-acetylmuramic acid 6-phosphate etherase
VGIQGAVSAIGHAIQQAIEPFKQNKNIQALRIREMWIGLAGGDREAIGGPIRVEIGQMLGLEKSVVLSVTNDIELLATASRHEYGADDVIVLVAGTGSIAMRYTRKRTGFLRVGRAGGWGALLGDDGSGFDIGRKAIRAALVQMGERTYDSRPAAETQDPLADIVRREFQTPHTMLEDSNLLNNILLSADGTEQTISQTKSKIASCARAVIAAQATSKRAQGIVLEATQSLVHLIRTVLAASGPNEGKPMLALAGGLANSSSVVDLLICELEKANLKHRISDIETVGNPAELGARFLAQKVWSQSSLATDST